MRDDETSSTRYADEGTLAELAALRKEVEELRAERASLAEQLTQTRFVNAIKYGTSHPEMYKTEVDTLKEQLAAAKLDSERYLWLRDTKEKKEHEPFCVRFALGYFDPVGCDGEELDVTIDSAMQERSHEQK